jgi:hypothetical protein
VQTRGDLVWRRRVFRRARPGDVEYKMDDVDDVG